MWNDRSWIWYVSVQPTGVPSLCSRAFAFSQIRKFRFPAAVVFRDGEGIKYCGSTSAIDADLNQHRGLTNLISSMSSAIWFAPSVSPSSVLSSTTATAQPLSAAVSLPVAQIEGKQAPLPEFKFTTGADSTMDVGDTDHHHSHSHVKAKEAKETMDSAITDSSQSAQTSQSERKERKNLKQDGRSSLADIPSHTVPEGPQSWQHFYNSAFSFRVHEACFIVQSKHEDSKNGGSLISDAYELVMQSTSGWQCKCLDYGAKDSCFHSQTAAQLSLDVKYRATFDASQAVIPCNSANNLWAVLGGAGVNRSVVTYKDSKVRSPGSFCLQCSFVQFRCDSEHCIRINRSGQRSCEHVALVMDSTGLTARRDEPVEEMDEYDVPVVAEDPDDDGVLEFVQSISERDVLMPMEEAFKLKMRAGLDKADSLPADGLKPVVPPGTRCQCCDELYDATTGLTTGLVRVSKVSVFFPHSCVRKVSLWALDCPKRTPACRINYDGKDRGLWICTKNTIFSEALFFNCFSLVSHVCVLCCLL